MKKNKYVLFAFFVFFIFSMKLNALTYGGCEYSEISRMKSFVSNINITYDYHIDSKQAYFDVIISNLVPEIYFIDSQTGKKYDYTNTINGELIIKNYTKTSGTYKFYSNLDKCYGVKLSNKYYNFPTYNIYYDDPLCESNRDYSLCQKWIKISYSYSEFKKLIQEYTQKKQEYEEPDEIEIIYEPTILDALVKIYVDYYYFILIGIIIACIIVMIINRKKNSFDL